MASIKIRITFPSNKFKELRIHRKTVLLRKVKQYKKGKAQSKWYIFVCKMSRVPMWFSCIRKSKEKIWKFKKISNRIYLQLKKLQNIRIHPRQQCHMEWLGNSQSAKMYYLKTQLSKLKVLMIQTRNCLFLIMIKRIERNKLIRVILQNRRVK